MSDGIAALRSNYLTWGPLGASPSPETPAAAASTVESHPGGDAGGGAGVAVRPGPVPATDRNALDLARLLDRVARSTPAPRPWVEVRGQGQTTSGGTRAEGQARAELHGQATAVSRSEPGGLSASVEASLGGSVGASGSVAGDWGHLSGSVVASAELRAAAAAYLRAAGGGGEAGVSAEVGLGVQVRARAEASLGGGLVSGRAEGTATAGAGADALARVSLSPHPLEASVQASAGGFAGSRAEFTIRGGVCGVTAGVHGEAWAGVGIRAEVAIGLHDGKFTFSLGLGVALGVGGFLRIDVEIDFQAIGKAIVDFFAQLFGGHPAAGAPGAHAAQLLDRTLASPPEVPEPEPEPEEAGPDVLPGDLALA